MEQLVTVIIPNYNHACYLKRRIDSVVNQTYQKIEVIILDDCSTDNSRDVIESFRNHTLVKHIIYNDSNTGSPFKQWEKGVELATGEWIWIAESDDYADTRFIETMLTIFPEPQRFGLLYSDSHIVINDKIIGETFASKRNNRLNSKHWCDKYTNDGIQEIEDYLMPYGTINNTSAVLFKTDILKKANPFDISFRFVGDKYAFIKVLAISDIAYISEPLNYYRAAADSKPKHTHDYFNYFTEHFLIFDWIHRNLNEINPEKFKTAFLLNSETSLLNFFNYRKAITFWKLFLKNRFLFITMLKFNFWRTLLKVKQKIL
jgi:glycosyltransferase involved in cell wall biosynthesis